MPPKRKSLAGSSSSTSKRTRPSSTAPDAPSIASRQPGPHFYKPGDLASYIAITVTDDDEDTEYTFVQNTTCQRWGAKLVTQCISCIEKQAFCGSCRFNGLRVFREGVDDNGNKGVDYGDYAFRGNQSQPLETPPAPAKLGKRPVKKASKRNTRSKRAQISLEDQLYSDEEPAAIKKSGKVYLKPVLDALLSPNTKDAAYALPIIAEAFSCHMRREDWHEKTHADATTEARSGLPGGARSMVRIQCTSFSRSTCDICWTSIFMGSYMCGCCGKELCLGL